jgi:hypothetical protein
MSARRHLRTVLTVIATNQSAGQSLIFNERLN